MLAMAGVFRALFWLWLIGSVVILVLRVSNKRSGATAATVDGSVSWFDSLLGKTAPDASGSAGAASTAATGLRIPPALDPSPPPGASAPSTLDRPVIRADDATSGPVAPTPAREPSAPASPGGARQGLFAPGGDQPIPPARTVAEALAGIEWPCGLTPVIDLATRHSTDREVAFSTTEATAAEVGARLGDALEALGYGLTSLDDTTVEADRPGTTVRVRLHPTAGTAERAGVPLFPTLAASAVVAVFTLVPPA